MSDRVRVEKQEILELVVLDRTAVVSVELSEDWLEEPPLHWNV